MNVYSHHVDWVVSSCADWALSVALDSLSVAQAECLDVVAVGKATDAYLLVSVARDDVSVVVVVTTIAAVGADAAAAQYLTQSDTHIFYRAHHMDMHVQISTILQ